MKKYPGLLFALLLAACGGGGGGGGGGSATTSSAAPSSTSPKACTDGPYTTDATKVCTDSSGNLVTAYVYVQPNTVIPDGTVITADTTWPTSGSPYFLAGTVRVAPGVTLTIGDNTVVETYRTVPCTAGCVGTIPTKGIINVAGTLNVGNQGPVQLLGVTAANTSLTQDAGGGIVSITHTVLQDAFVQISDAAPFSMTYSQATHLNVTPIVRNGVTTFEAGTNGYPRLSKSATVKGNTFVDSAAFAFDPSVFVQNNLFINMVDPLVLIDAFPAGAQAPTGIAQRNSFLFKKDSPNVNRIVIESHGTYNASTVHSLDFSNNFWGVTDNTTIQSRVLDSTDTSSPRLPNVILYAPPLQNPDAATPADPQSATPNV
ncbi:hypothetical protein C8K18_12933 [Paraburkholderia sp. GV068]|uniref:hypothetical protein n=1 Tax=unclassified Paraburkholderia TaxID=2615204 RepID=UPI000D314E2E|nr:MULTISPECIES: hypothetical protein [unclassified Paraburkholderia]PTQ90909.1 hypothetical protein C8K19_13125 [Paraburkholderia sp. GV072]PUA93728.1 hypothetical protein C8K18_12933 [Paraburkholderia sp. GV068]